MTTTVPTFDASAFEVARLVTVPFLIMDPDQKYFVKFDDAIRPDDTTFSERVRKARAGTEQQSQEPIHIAKITNLATGTPAKLVAHSTLESNLTEAYPDHSYVGKMFQIEKKSKAQGKKYFTFEILELKFKGTAEGTANAEHKGKK